MTVNLLAVGGPANGEWFAWDPNGSKELRVAIPPKLVWKNEFDPVEPWPDIEVTNYVAERLAVSSGATRHYYRHWDLSIAESMELLRDMVFEAFIEQGDD